MMFDDPRVRQQRGQQIGETKNILRSLIFDTRLALRLCQLSPLYNMLSHNSSKHAHRRPAAREANGWPRASTVGLETMTAQGPQLFLLSLSSGSAYRGSLLNPPPGFNELFLPAVRTALCSQDCSDIHTQMLNTGPEAGAWQHHRKFQPNPWQCACSYHFNSSITPFITLVVFLNVIGLNLFAQASGSPRIYQKTSLNWTCDVTRPLQAQCETMQVIHIIVTYRNVIDSAPLFFFRIESWVTPLYLSTTRYLEVRIVHTVVLSDRRRVNPLRQHLKGPIPITTALSINGLSNGEQEKQATILQPGNIFSCSRVDETWFLQGSRVTIQNSQ